MGDLQEVAEDLVVLDLEARDACAVALPGLDAGDGALALPGQVTQFVEVGVHTPADESALGQRGGRLVHQPGVDVLSDVLGQVPREVAG